MVKREIDMKILFIGNSITLHGKCSYWPGEWGMAASKKENDYVHFLVNRFRNDGLQVDYAVTNFFKWEVMDYDRDEVLPLLDDYLKDSYDYIVLQLGENITSTATLERDFDSLLSYLSKHMPKAKLLALSSFFIKDDVDNIKETCVFKWGGRYISLKDIRGTLPYMAGNNIKVEADGRIYTINHAGVALHPGDEAMAVMAGRLYDRIMDEENIIENENKKRDLFKDKYIAFIRQGKRDIRKMLLLENYEAALGKISALADVLYNSNQFYVDADLEAALCNIQRRLYGQSGFLPIGETDSNTIIFYDGFGLDNRGLAYIYLKALTQLDYKVIYLTISQAQGNIKRITSLIENAGGEIVFIPTDRYILWYQYIYKVFSVVKPKKAFFYTTPYDVSAVMAFNQFAGQVERYQINLTDHAFWLGINAFDYCLEFRDYGATLSQEYRNINREKLLVQPFYPDINTKAEFQGFPFRKMKGDFVVFSGGFLYKTIDENLTYYRIVEYLLLKYPQIKFWYAGYGSEDERKPINELIFKYPGRVFYTSERKDLFQVMQNIDMYINTYPLGGGLMTQYSALAGKAPLTFSTKGFCAVETLLEYGKLNLCTTDIDEFVNMVDDYINTNTYTNGVYCEKLKYAIVTENQFRDNLRKILTSNVSDYQFKIIQIRERLEVEQNIAWNRFYIKFK